MASKIGEFPTRIRFEILHVTFEWIMCVFSISQEDRREALSVYGAEMIDGFSLGSEDATDLRFERASADSEGYSKVCVEKMIVLGLDEQIFQIRLAPKKKFLHPFARIF